MKWILIALVAGAVVVTGFVGGEIASRFAASDRYSSYRGGAEGTKALYLTLHELGIAAERRHEPTAPEGPAAQDGRDLLFIVADETALGRIDAGDADRLLSWVKQGNLLVVAHDAPFALLDPLGVSVVWAGGGGDAIAGADAPVVRVPRGDPVAANAGLAFATLRRPGRYQVGHGSYAVLLGTGSDPAAIAIERGDGRIVLVSDPWLFSNQGVKHDGNLELALGLVRDRRGGAVSFEESIHGFTADRSIVGYLRRQGLEVALLQGILVLVVAVFAWRGRRLPERRPAAPPGPGSRDFLDAMGRIYANAGFAAEAAREIAADLVRHAADELRISGRPPAEVLQAIAAIDRPLAGDVAAAVARGESARFGSPGRGREPALVGYHNQTLALAERLSAAVRGGRRKP
jgi:hypothetical protein